MRINNSTPYVRAWSKVEQMSSYDCGKQLQAGRSTAIAREQLARASINAKELAISYGVIPADTSDLEFVKLDLAEFVQMVGEEMERQRKTRLLGCW